MTKNEALDKAIGQAISLGLTTMACYFTPSALSIVANQPVTSHIPDANCIVLDDYSPNLANNPLLNGAVLNYRHASLTTGALEETGACHNSISMRDDGSGNGKNVDSAKLAEALGELLYAEGKFINISSAYTYTPEEIKKISGFTPQEILASPEAYQAFTHGVKQKNPDLALILEQLEAIAKLNKVMVSTGNNNGTEVSAASLVPGIISVTAFERLDHDKVAEYANTVGRNMVKADGDLYGTVTKSGVVVGEEPISTRQQRVKPDPLILLHYEKEAIIDDTIALNYLRKLERVKKGFDTHSVGEVLENIAELNKEYRPDSRLISLEALCKPADFEKGKKNPYLSEEDCFYLGAFMQDIPGKLYVPLDKVSSHLSGPTHYEEVVQLIIFQDENTQERRVYGQPGDKIPIADGTSFSTPHRLGQEELLVHAFPSHFPPENVVDADNKRNTRQR